jgi:hypothetical protein
MQFLTKKTLAIWLPLPSLICAYPGKKAANATPSPRDIVAEIVINTRNEGIFKTSWQVAKSFLF